MFTEVAYLGKKHEDIKDNTVPIKITAVGHYLVNKSYRIPTNRRLGRKDYQLLYIAEGRGHFKFDGKKYVYEKGYMFLFRPGEEQIYDLFKTDAPETYWVHFTGYDVEKILDEYNMPKSTISYIGTHTDYSWYFRQMIYELKERKPNYDKMLVNMLMQLFIVIERNISQPREKVYKEEIEKAIYYFKENYYKNINIEEYANKNFINPYWFIRTFKEATTKTPMQYIISIRIEKAKELLENTQKKISDISNSIGYDNPLYFSRIFKKYSGSSPTNYRKEKQIHINKKDSPKGDTP